MLQPSSGRAAGRAPSLIRSGGWVVAAAIVATSLAVGWNMVRLVSHRHRAVGDGRHVSTYGFDLSPCLVSRATLVAAGIPRDGLPVLTDPESWPLRLYRAWATGMRSRFLVDSDRTVGVSFGGVDRAYPLRVMAWHEAVNDVVGGVPIVVTYNPLCDSVVVFSAKVEGRRTIFGISGLLSDSNQLLYDRRKDPRASSLWSQLRMRAVTGRAAAAGLHLRPLACELTTWGAWCRAHPDTSVLAPQNAMLDDYERDPYSPYFGSDQLRFPVANLMSTRRFARKTPIVVPIINGVPYGVPLPVVIASGSRGTWRTSIAGRTLVFSWAGEPATVDLVPDPADPIPVAYAFMFAWDAAEGERTIWIGSPGP
jgi:Protein of unknown function (DUF3179)